MERPERWRSKSLLYYCGYLLMIAYCESSDVYHVQTHVREFDRLETPL